MRECGTYMEHSTYKERGSDRARMKISGRYQASVRISGFGDMLQIMLQGRQKRVEQREEMTRARHDKAGNIQGQRRMGVEPTHERASARATVLKTARPTGTRTPPQNP